MTNQTDCQAEMSASETTTPGACSTLVSDPDSLTVFTSDSGALAKLKLAVGAGSQILHIDCLHVNGSIKKGGISDAQDHIDPFLVTAGGRCRRR
jgi:hypothetical protein